MSIQLKNITKKFGNITACDGIDLELESGKVHSIVGDNGAGKSTLMKILVGLVRPDFGEIKINNTVYESINPRLAKHLKISMVHQGFSLVEQLTVLENLQLSKELSGNSLFSRLEKVNKKVNKKEFVSDNSTGVLSHTFFNLDLNTQVKDLDMGQRQQLEILKALDPELNTLILDEPTSFLNPEQIIQLKMMIKNLTEQGCCVVFISHDLDNVVDISDSICVLESGKVVENANYGKQDTRSNLASSVSEMDEPILRLVNLSVEPTDRWLGFQNLNLSVSPSEIVSLSGADGLMDVFLGDCKPTGEIFIGKNLLSPHISGDVVDSGIAVIPKDKERSACIPKMTVAENLFLFSPLGKAFLDFKAMSLRVKELMEEYNISPANPEMIMSELSGGNQQKILLARELSSNPKILVIESLLEGLDVTAASEISWKIQRAAARGIGILMLTNDPELNKLAHTKIHFNHDQ